MKKIVCELCECMEFTKEGGMFICNSCGTKYTAEEARGMMREMEGAAPAIVGGTAPGLCQYFERIKRGIYKLFSKSIGDIYPIDE